ncbi:MAG: DUF4295 domain-containing protein [Chryseobacterium sp.]|nr:MAG: DUF4295 domain-containing protein [Chryseobacterium sp.]
MAKKVVATLQGGAGSKKMTKVIKMVKSSKSEAYVFEEKVMNADEVEAYLKNELTTHIKKTIKAIVSL